MEVREGVGALIPIHVNGNAVDVGGSCSANALNVTTVNKVNASKVVRSKHMLR
jgi:hypothetical protein